MSAQRVFLRAECESVLVTSLQYDVVNYMLRFAIKMHSIAEGAADRAVP
jgi:hypothetical protein